MSLGVIVLGGYCTQGSCHRGIIVLLGSCPEVVASRVVVPGVVAPGVVVLEPTLRNEAKRFMVGLRLGNCYQRCHYG